MEFSHGRPADRHGGTLATERSRLVVLKGLLNSSSQVTALPLDDLDLRHFLIAHRCQRISLLVKIPT